MIHFMAVFGFRRRETYDNSLEKIRSRKFVLSFPAPPRELVRDRIAPRTAPFDRVAHGPGTQSYFTRGWILAAM